MLQLMFYILPPALPEGNVNTSNMPGGYVPNVNGTTSFLGFLGGFFVEKQEIYGKIFKWEDSRREG